MSGTGLLRADAVVVGGGLAGLWGALHLPEDWEVVVVDKDVSPAVGSSPWAQGGMAVAVAPDDSAELHAQDTIRAGAGLCDAEAVQVLVEEAGAALEELVELGCAFDRSPDDSFDLHLEGGQSVARSVHWADATGKEIMRVVVGCAKRRARRLSGSAERLLRAEGRCVGVRVDTDHGEIDIVARGVLLATGGCGALWPATTNPEVATGDALALAWEAGVAVSDLEFMQFHPTALATGGLRRVLLTEALRGAGAQVVDERRERFLLDVHADGELAPRDVVARAIADRGGAFLDCRPVPEVRERFPNIAAAVAEHGFDLDEGPVPVAPAAHYFLGGVRTDVWGRTSLPGLYAAGECAATGVHGANRMAGNSLTESVVFGRRAAMTLAEDAPRGVVEPPGSDEEAAPTVHVVRGDELQRLREAMELGCGLVRTGAGLEAARAVAEEVARDGGPAERPAGLAASLICRAAIERTESRGVHHRSDHPSDDPSWEGRHVVMERSVSED